MTHVYNFDKRPANDLCFSFFSIFCTSLSIKPTMKSFVEFDTNGKWHFMNKISFANTINHFASNQETASNPAN